LVGYWDCADDGHAEVDLARDPGEPQRVGALTGVPVVTAEETADMQVKTVSDLHA
jgi:hypothetical protein